MREFSIQLPDGITISAQLAETDLPQSEGVYKSDLKNGFVWYCLPATEFNDHKVVFRLCFYQGTLDCVNISIANPELYGHGWDDWCESKETARAKDTAEWLQGMGYETGTYSWGEIWAGYEPQSAAGSATVRFTK
ncbi:MAG: hypothetical protein ABIK07_06985 [Planctomycetota bacterium]